MKHGIKRFYIMPAVWRTVTDSQVFNWVEVLNKSNVETDIISLVNNRHRQDEEKVAEIEKRTGGKFYQFKLHPLLLNDIILTVRLFFLYARNVFKYDTIIFQTRMADLGHTFGLIKLLPKVKTIFESRGATIEERAFVHNDFKSLKRNIKEYVNLRSEEKLISGSHGVICVSDALKKYYVSKFKMDTSKTDFLVIPGAASRDLFYYEKSLREEYRSLLGYSDEDVVLVYSGALNQKWEIPDVVFNFLKSLAEFRTDFKFLMITPDLELVNEYSKKYGISQDLVAIQSSFDEVNKYLNAADVALLLREDIVMNNVASPTKFAEYLMAGLPTVLSHGIHDFAEILRETGYGVILEDNTLVNQDLADDIVELKSKDRKAVATWAARNISKERYVEKYRSYFLSI